MKGISIVYAPVLGIPKTPLSPLHLLSRLRMTLSIMIYIVIHTQVQPKFVQVVYSVLPDLWIAYVNLILEGISIVYALLRILIYVVIHTQVQLRFVQVVHFVRSVLWIAYVILILEGISIVYALFSILLCVVIHTQVQLKFVQMVQPVLPIQWIVNIMESIGLVNALVLVLHRALSSFLEITYIYFFLDEIILFGQRKAWNSFF